MSSLATILNKLQQRFTYRQRFLFFAAIFFLVTPLPVYWVWMTLKAEIALKEHELNGIKNYVILKDLAHKISSYSIQDNEDDVSALHSKIADGFSELEALNSKPTIDTEISLGKSFYTYAPIVPIINSTKSELHELLAITTARKMPEEEIATKMHEIDKLLFDLIIASGLMSDPTLPYPTLLNVTFQNELISTTGLSDEYQAIQQAYGTYNGLLTKAARNNKIASSDSPQQELREYNLAILGKIIKSQIRSNLWHYYGFLLLFLVVTVSVIVFVLLKVLSRHLMDLLNHIEALAKGDFSTRFYPQSEDEFSLVGITLNEMAGALSDISGRIHSLGNALASSSGVLTYEVMIHETNIHDQEHSISTTGQIAGTIARDCHEYVKIISDLSNSAFQHPLTHNAQKTLTSLRKTLHEISIDSQHTLITLQEVQKELSEANQHSAMLRKVGEESRMLSFNAAIEASLSGQQHPQFNKIAQAIQQFTERTTHASKKIEAILEETSHDIFNAENTISQCLTEMDTGREVLKSVDSQLHSIGLQVLLQMEKFEEFNNAMKKQAFEAESIIEAITNIRKNTQTSAEIFQQLHNKVQEMDGAARELKHLLEVFFTETSTQRK